ncbi:MAG: hypothetical protein HC822_07475 [Oscillochloris sp.]|nr:hypothetical protein [Oscillochloris sp.]
MDGRKLPTWPIGCVFSIFNLLLLFNTFAMLGALSSAAAFAPMQAVSIPYAAVVVLLLAEMTGAILLRRRNPYAARVLWWGIGLTFLFGGIFVGFTNWMDAASGVSKVTS